MKQRIIFLATLVFFPLVITGCSGQQAERGLGETTEVNGVPCVDPDVDSDGRLENCLLARDAVVAGSRFPSGSRLFFDPPGVLRCVFFPRRPSVFGIHCYVFDRQGENAFSFLLNSHHKLFVDANLSAQDLSETSRAEMVEKATKVGITAFMQQIEAARIIRD